MTGHSKNGHHTRLQSGIVAAMLLLAALLLSACDGGQITQTNPEREQDDSSGYTGPAAATDDVSDFRNSLWNLVRPSNRCAGCHDAGGQAPTFANNQDVNQAYQAANTVVNLDAPDESLMVTKVAEGHNCWENDPSFCAEMIASAIETWAGGEGDATNRIELEAPPHREPGDSLAFPGDPSLFSPVHDLLTQHCAGCHTETASTPQQPYFAQSDLAAAYEAAKDKINLDTPADSRFVLRLGRDFHNCWSQCSDDAAEMRSRIEDLAAQATTVSLDPGLVNSRALGMSDGLLATTGGRYEGNLIALYDFSAGTATNEVLDTSGVEPALHLDVSGGCQVSDYGLRCPGDGQSKAQASPSDSAKLAERITRTGEYSVEAWVVPGNVSQEGPARIVSYSGGDDRRNFTLGQSLYNYDFLNRSSGSDGNGEPALSTPDGDEVLQATLQHVVLTFDPVNGRRIYVNGELASQADPQAGEGIAGWNDTYTLVLGNETSFQYPWEGAIRLLAIYERALDEEQINQNFEAGVGQKFFLLFHVGEIMGASESEAAYDSYILFEVSQFDQYSYLFDRPHFVNLNEGYEPTSAISIEGLRIGINGREAQVGQAYVNLDTDVTAESYDPAALGQQLSRMGTIISLERGPEQDEFFLTFDDFAGQGSSRTPPGQPSPTQPVAGDPQSVIGLRTFDEIDATMSSVTGIPRDNTDVRETFERVKQQLPTSPEIEGFLSAHQMGMAQLAIEYCSALVENPTARQAFFGSFDFDQPVGTAFASEADRQQIVDALYDKAIGQNLATAPSRADIYFELADPSNVDDGNRPANLFDRLTESCPTGCDAERTRTIVKALCASTLGSTATLIQ